MANHKSAKKASKQSQKRAIRNHRLLSEARGRVKSLRSALAKKESSKDELVRLFQRAESLLMRVAGKGVLKSRAASRYVSRLHSALQARL